MKKVVLFLGLLIMACFSNFAQDTTSLWDMSLEDLMNIDVKIASNTKSYSVKEAPAVVSVITSDEIKKMGARDLIDVLRIIPGFDFGTDVEGAVSMIYRGIWVQEGKTLLMIDGQMMNEQMYACNTLGLHIPIANIDKIEIMRGPGSATYGDCAETSVINVITKSGEQLQSVNVGGDISYINKHFPWEKNIYVNLGSKHNDFDYSIFGRYASGSRSNFDFVDAYGNSFNSYVNKIESYNFNLKFNYKNLSFVAIFDKYNLMAQDFLGMILSRPYKDFFTTGLCEIKYIKQLNNNFQLIAKFNYKYDDPWHQDETPDFADSFYYPSNFYVNQYKATLMGQYDYKNFSFSLGTEDYLDYSKNRIDNFWNGKNVNSYYLWSVIAQTSLTTKYVNIIAESRYDKHNLYGGVFSPRVALTKSFSRFNYKLVWNRAFRAPAIMDIDLNYFLDTTVSKPQIKPEISNIFNVQLGYNISKFYSASVCYFYAEIHNPIVYEILDNTQEGYDNGIRTGSQGIEVELTSKYKRFMLQANYSYYTSKGLNEVDYYKVIYNGKFLDNVMLGAPTHKAVLNFYYDLSKIFSVNYTLAYTSEKYGYAFNSAVDSMTLVQFKPEIMMNFVFSTSNLIKNLDISLGFYNILNTKNYFVEPYDGGHPPLLEKGREIMIKLNYRLCKM